MTWKRSLWALGCFPAAGNLVFAGTVPSNEFGRGIAKSWFGAMRDEARD